MLSHNPMMVVTLQHHTGTPGVPCLDKAMLKHDMQLFRGKFEAACAVYAGPNRA